MDRKGRKFGIFHGSDPDDPRCRGVENHGLWRSCGSAMNIFGERTVLF